MYFLCIIFLKFSLKEFPLLFPKQHLIFHFLPGVLSQLNDSRSQLEDLWAARKLKLDLCLQLQVFERDSMEVRTSCGWKESCGNMFEHSVLYLVFFLLLLLWSTFAVFVFFQACVLWFPLVCFVGLLWWARFIFCLVNSWHSCRMCSGLCFSLVLHNCK